MGGNRRIFKEGEDVVFQLPETVSELPKWLFHLAKALIEQFVKAFKPCGSVHWRVGVLVAPMNCFSQKFLQALRPVLAFVKLMEVIEIPQQMGNANLMAFYFHRKICRVPVGGQDNIFQSVLAELVVHFFRSSAFRYPCQSQ